MAKGDTQETQHLIHCLKALNPDWKYKDFQKALCKSQTAISFLLTGKSALRPDGLELARRLIADRIAELTNDQHSYFTTQRIARYYEEIQRGQDWSSPEGSAPPDEYTIALSIARHESIQKKAKEILQTPEQAEAIIRELKAMGYDISK